MLMCFSYVEVFVLIVRSEARYTSKTGLTLTRWFTFAFGINYRELSMLRIIMAQEVRQADALQASEPRYEADNLRDGAGYPIKAPFYPPPP